MNVASVADKLAQDIRSQDSLHEPMVKDLAKLAASSTVTEEDFHSTFLKALGRYVHNSFFISLPICTFLVVLIVKIYHKTTLLIKTVQTITRYENTFIFFFICIC